MGAIRNPLTHPLTVHRPEGVGVRRISAERPRRKEIDMAVKLNETGLRHARSLIDEEE